MFTFRATAARGEVTWIRRYDQGFSRGVKYPETILLRLVQAMMSPAINLLIRFNPIVVLTGYLEHVINAGRIHSNVNKSSKWTHIMHRWWRRPGASLLSLLQITALFYGFYDHRALEPH